MTEQPQWQPYDKHNEEVEKWTRVLQEMQQQERNRSASFLGHVAAYTGHVNTGLAKAYMETGDSGLFNHFQKQIWEEERQRRACEEEKKRRDWEIEKRQKREHVIGELNQRMGGLNLAPWPPIQPLTGQEMLDDWRLSRTTRSFKPSPMTRAQMLEEDRGMLTHANSRLTESEERKQELERQINQVKEGLSGKPNIFKRWWYGRTLHMLEKELLFLEEERARLERDKERLEKRLGIS